MGKLPFSRILCPVDLDGAAGAAIEAACDAAQGAQPVVYLLHVVSAAPAVAGVPLEPYTVTRHDVETELQQMIPRQAQGRIRFELLARKGDATREILRAVAELDVDAVVMATHGRKGVSRLLLGSVAEKVVRESAVPVLTIR
jgi:nucleotide-binding universal stress UspA family protein